MDYSSLLKMLRPDEDASASMIDSDRLDKLAADPSIQDNTPPSAPQSGAESGVMSGVPTAPPVGNLAMTAQVPPSMIQKSPAVSSIADPSGSGGGAGGSGNGNGSDVAAYIASKKYGFNPLMDAKALSNAQSLQNDQQLTANLGQAFDKIGASIARTNQSPEAASFYQGIRDESKNPVKDIIQQRQAAQQGQQFAQQQENEDPNSNRAAVMRQLAGPLAAKSGLPSSALNGMSVNDLETAKPLIETGAKLKTSEQEHKDALEMKKLAMGSAHDQKDLARLEMAQKGLNGDKEFGDAQKQKNDIDSVSAMLDDALKNPKSASLSMLPIKMIPAITGIKRLNPQEIQMAAGAQDIGSQLNRWSTKMSEGKMTPSDYTSLKRVVDIAKNTANSNYSDRLNLHVNQYKKLTGKNSDDAVSDLGLGEPTQLSAPRASSSKSLNLNDPKVQQAKAAGYSEKEIQEYLNGK